MKNEYIKPDIFIKRFEDENVLTSSSINSEIIDNLQAGKITVDGKQLSKDDKFMGFVF